MKTNSWILTLVLLVSSVLLSKGVAQEKELGKLYLTGKVVDERKRGISSVIHLYKNGKMIEEFETNRIGRFQFSIPLQDSVAFVVITEGHVSKTVFVDANVPEHKQYSDYNFPFFIDLYPIGRVPAHVDLNRPVGKIIFSGSQFIYDIKFTKQQNEMLKEFVRERKDMKVREINNE
jgi:hypothetical protein